MKIMTLRPGDGYSSGRPGKKENVRQLQRSLNLVIDSNLVEDGIYGPATIRAVNRAQRRYYFQVLDEAVPALVHWLSCLAASKYGSYADDSHGEGSHQPSKPDRLIFADKVSPAFAAKVREIAGEISQEEEAANWLMALMHFETAGTFSPSIKNMAGSGATGLIQFIPSTMVGLMGMEDTADNRERAVAWFETMPAIEQLDMVKKYFEPYEGRLTSLEDMYMAVLWPAAVGKDNSHVLFSRGIRYRQNAGLDVNKDHRITKEEAASKVRDSYRLGKNRG